MLKELQDNINGLIRILQAGKFNCADEIKCQQQIDAHLTKLGACFIREYNLENGIVDFFFPNSGIALEIKASKRWSKLRVFRQCERYCTQNDVVTGLVLATATAMSMPDNIKGKPVAVFSLSAGSV